MNCIKETRVDQPVMCTDGRLSFYFPNWLKLKSDFFDIISLLYQ